MKCNKHGVEMKVIGQVGTELFYACPKCDPELIKELHERNRELNREGLKQ